MAEIGSLQVRIGADTEGLKKGIKESEGALDRLSGVALKGSIALAKMGAAAVAAGAALVTALAKQGLDAVDAQAKLARSMDATIDGLQGLQIAADRAGVSSGALQASAQQLNRSLAEASRTGSGPAADALNRLGLSAEALSRMDVDERMATLSDRMHEMGMSAGEAQDTLRDLGIRSREMALLMIDGGDAIRQAREDVDAFGLSISDVDAANIERANDRLQDVMRSVDMVRQRLAAALAPVIEMISNRFLDASRASGGFRDAIDRGVAFGVRAFAQIVNVIEVIRRTLSVVTQTTRLYYATTTETMAGIYAAIIDGAVEGFNVLIRTINRIPGIDVDEMVPPGISDRLREIAEQAGLHAEDAQRRIVEAFTKPLPGEAIRQAYADAVEAANAASAAQIEAAAERNRMLSELGDDMVATQAIQEEQLDAQNTDALQRRLDRMRESLMDEETLEAHRFQQRLEELRGFHDQQLIDTEDYYRMLEQVAAQHEANMNRIRSRGQSQDKQQTSAYFKDIFAQTKQFAVADAIVKAYQGISTTLSRYPWPVAGALAAVHGAAAFRQVSAIRAQSLGGGGGVSTAGLGGAAAASTSAAQAAPARSGGVQTLQVSGISSDQLFSGQAVRELASKLLDFQRDGGKVVFAD